MRNIQTDVLVVGGGTAGVTAALGAARHGVRVVVAERDGALGGVATRAGIHSYYHGRSAGVQTEIDALTTELGGILGGQPMGFHPEARRLAVDQMLAGAGCTVVFHALAVGVVKEGEWVRGVVLETPEGTLTVTAAVTVDSTGDGAVCALAGVPYAQGREWDGVANCYSLIPRYARGERLELWGYDAGWVSGISVRDLSRAYHEGRKRARAMLGVGLFDGLLAVGPQLGIRESRHIKGDYRLTVADLALDRRFPDVVMRCAGHLDLHAYDYANESLFAQIWICILGLWRQPIGGDVPFRCFLPKGVDGLLIACRALSQDRDTSLALRMQRDMQQVGEVAGTAAALCCQARCQPRELDVPTLQECLIQQGILSRADLTRPSEPWIGLRPGQGEGTGGAATAGVPPEAGVPSGRLDTLVAALGTPEEGKALWWLWQLGQPAVAPLIERLDAETGAKARGIALALALLGSAKGVPNLVRSVAARDADTLPGERVPARWIACLVALKVLGDPSAVPVCLNALPGEKESSTILHILHYFIRVEGETPPHLRRQVVASVEAILERRDLGVDYHLWGGVAASLRWSIELTGAYLLASLGHSGAELVFERYRADPRGFVRQAATLIEARANAGGGRNGLVEAG